MAKEKVQLVSMAEFGKMCGGISGEAISKAAKNGKVYRDLRSGKINPNHPKNVAYQKAGSRQRDKATGIIEEEEAKDLSGASLKSLTTDDLKKLRLIGQIEEKDLKNDIERGKYIERTTVKNIFQELEAIDKKSLMNIAVRAAPAILARLEVDETHLAYVVSEIKGEIWKVLEQKKELLGVYIDDQ